MYITINRNIEIYIYFCSMFDNMSYIVEGNEGGEIGIYRYAEGVERQRRESGGYIDIYTYIDR